MIAAAAGDTIITDKRPVAEEERLCIGVQDSTASGTVETVYMPTITI